jgi:hypothetical protein
MDRSPTTFEYNYDLLARWLLKLSFNSARASGTDGERLGQYKECLINHSIPIPDDFSITVDLVLPSIDGGGMAVLPNSNRICSVQFPGGEADWCTVRLVAINSFYFWILLQDRPDSEVHLEHASIVLSAIPGTLIPRTETYLEIILSGISTLQAHRDWVPALKAAGPWPRRR